MGLLEGVTSTHPKSKVLSPLASILFLQIASLGTIATPAFTLVGQVDRDGDGFTVANGDCNDNNRAQNPAADEVFDGIDNDCDGQIDEDAQEGYDLGHWTIAFADAFDGTTNSCWKLFGPVTIDGGIMRNPSTGSALLPLDTSRSCPWWGDSAPVGHEIAVHTKIRLIGHELTRGAWGAVTLILPHDDPATFLPVKKVSIKFLIREGSLQLIGPEPSDGDRYPQRIATDQWHDVFISIRKGEADFYFDGKLIFRQKLMPWYEKVDSILLHSFRFQTEFSDFQLFTTNEIVEQLAVKEAINQIRNASFEDNRETTPSFWFPSGAIIPRYGTMKGFTEQWGVDRSTASHGDYSFKLVRDASNLADLRQHLFLKDAGSYMISMNLKTDVETMSVAVRTTVGHSPLGLGAVGPSATIPNINSEWKRYAVPLEFSSPGKYSLFIEPKVEGTLWIDAIQLERGDEPTLFVLHPRDEPVNPVIRDPVDSLPGIVARLLARPPTIDGQLDPREWPRASPIFKDNPTATGKVGLHDGKLYFAFELKGSDPSLEDRLRIVLTPYHHHQDFFIFQMNRVGQTVEQRGFDFDWQVPWRVAVQED